MKDNTAKIVEFIKKTLKALPEDNKDYEYFAKFLNSYENALELTDTEEKEALLQRTAVYVMNQLVMNLFRNNTLEDAVEKEYRSLMTLDEAEKAYEDAIAERKKEGEEYQKMAETVQQKQLDVDLFKQVLNGKTVEEAKEALANYAAQSQMRG